jgi:hypothetical protein
MGALHRAFREADIATLDNVLADDFTFSDPNGPVMSKQRWLADIALGNLVFESVETGPVDVRRVGDRIVVDGEGSAATFPSYFSRKIDTARRLSFFTSTVVC